MDFNPQLPSSSSHSIIKNLEEEVKYSMGGQTRTNKEEEDVSQSPLSIVGELFEIGIAGNAAISGLMGFQTKVEDRSAWQLVDDVWVKTPNWFHNKSPETEELFEELGVTWLPIEVEGGYIAVVSFKSLAFVTKIFKSYGTARACALHHILLVQDSDDST